MSSQCLLLLLALVAAALHFATCQDEVDAATWWKKPDPSPPTWCNKHNLPGRYYPGKFRPGKRCKPTPPPAPTCPTGKVPVAYVNLLRSNDSLPGVSSKSGPGMFGMMKDKDGQDVWRVLPNANAAQVYSAVPANAGGYSFPAGAAYGKFRSYSNAPDIPTLFQRGKDVYMVNHFEYNQPGSVYLSKLSQDKASGKLTPVATEAIKDGPGTWFPCSGTITPWDSHLGSEEYPADCRVYQDTMLASTCTAKPDFTACGWAAKDGFPADSAMGMSRSIGGWGMHPISGDDEGVDRKDADIIAFESALGFGNQAVLDNFRKEFNCYAYGWSPEVSVANDGSARYLKWLTLGRMSHESAIVMPDLKTVYTTDDGTNCGLFMFKADRPADLSSGKLYAAKFTQDGAADNFKVSWILLGSGNQAALEKLVASKPKFSDMFETAAPTNTTANFCPAGFKATNTPVSPYLTTGPDGKSFYIECLKIKPGMETAAAFLETRRVAAMMGATTEFEKEEGITFSAKHNKLFIAYAKISNGMVDDKKYSAGQPGDVNMPSNACGAIFTFDLDSSSTAVNAKAILYGTPLAAPDADGNKCELGAISNPDNIHFTNSILFIAEDTSSHLNNVLWAYDVDSKSLTRILSSPRLAEVTGIYISYVGDYAYLAMAMQHPEEDTGPKDITQPIAASQRGYVGYLGPLSAACLKAGKKPVFEGIAAAKTPADKSAVLFSTSVTYV
ncbi:hypothetical protein OEZ86_000388 [Tetradesmus obliquus]|nr:hypothetical protein OEZ86_000388 [Tetradesmus obliquus]